MSGRSSERHVKPSIELHIEELVLHGFASADRDRIGGAVQQELTRLLAEHGISSTLTSVNGLEQLGGATFPLAVGAKPEAVGSQVAEAIFEGLSR